MTTGKDDTIRKIEEAIAYTFTDRELLLRALTHPSYVAESVTPIKDNQRLEFLGDAVLQLVATQLLFDAFPDLDEGKLTRVRSAVTKEPALVSYADDLGIGESLLLGIGEERSGGRARASNLGDAFEALLGAMFLDGGIAPVYALVSRYVVAFVEAVDEVLLSENPKGALQELAQQRYGEMPVYEVLDIAGPEHEPTFEVSVTVKGEELARASAGSRRRAESEAARLALTLISGGEKNP